MVISREPELGANFVMYSDREFQRPAVRLNPGGYAVTDQDLILITVLGSCVAVCAHDHQAGIGGMNHFMLPGDDPACQRQRGGLSSLYGVNAMEVLINGMLRLGASKTRIVTKLFGGGNVINTMRATRIGERNAEFVRTYLTREGIKVASMDLRGDYPRKVCYFTSSGRALAKGLRSRQAIVEVSSKEQAYDGSLRRELSHAGEVELF